MAGGSGERGDKSGLFRWDPVSFRLNRRSALRMELRRALAEKFLQCLGDYADETLIEYVIVLLCNGKDQYQAREGLVDFLGDGTENFVAWLWDYLSRKIDAMDGSGYASLGRKRMKVQRLSREVQAQAADNEEQCKRSNYYVGSQSSSVYVTLSSRSLQKDMHGGVIPEGLLRLENDLHGNTSYRSPSEKKLRTSITEERIDEEPSISRPGGFSSLAAAGAPYSPCSNESWHCKRGEKQCSSTRSSRNFHRPRSEVVAIGRNMKSRNRGKEVKPVQRNVWDRLGKPFNETTPYIIEGDNSLFAVPAATFAPIHPLVTQNLPSTLPLLPHAQTHSVPSSSFPKGVVRTSICSPMHANGEIVNKLKRQFEQIESHLQTSVVSSKSVKRVPAKQRLGISMGAHQPLPEGYCFSSGMVNEPVVVHTGLKPEIFSNANSDSSDQRLQIVPTKEKEALENSESGNSSQEPPSKVSDMKVNLEDTENDIQELQSEQAQLENLKPDSETNHSSGAQQSHMEDMESRTVLITNVHFGATKEAIVSYFAKCGPVTKVIMLRDTITGKPKGAACVTFMKQGSVAKAISLSGTSLFSRILKVMRKADAPAGLLEQPHQVWRPAHQLPPSSWNSLHSCTITTHHQWRRETNPSVSK